MSKRFNEANFEATIEKHLLSHGYAHGDDKNFDKERALFPEDVIAFIQHSQPQEWQKLEKLQKSNARETLLKDLTDALDSPHRGGCLGVLRDGFKCYGILFRMAHFKPASGLNPDTQKRYEHNILSITRQVHYSPNNNNSIDMVIAVNGIPIITMELKNRFTGQSWEHAVKQYKVNRSPADAIFQFNKRSLVHFAVDSDQVHMTTKLDRRKTTFLPFNKGDKGGAGNPDNPDGFKTSYLWENILAKDSLLEIIGSFIHLEGKKKIIFPRYHQLDAVRKMTAHARDNGTGKNYLIQHSAGSGKSNSIAWLAHRLSSLHNHKDQKIFDSVIVITDRLVLDKQLQETIGQFEKTPGTVVKVDQDSAQLADAINSNALIIVTTLQKFPFAADKMKSNKNKNYAVIIDEAHSSQGGERAADMKGILSEQKETIDYEEEVIEAMKKRGRQKNISFFAFTATPKYKTIEIFGQLNPEDEPKAFHNYTMRQAIEEGFILSVLKHYTTYQTYYRLLKTIEDDPSVERRKAARALARFVSLHPTNIAQKTEVIIEHFRAHTMRKIGGKAKAMVVTQGRPHAIRYKEAFDRYIEEKGYKNIGVLVAFSAFTDESGKKQTEAGHNEDAKGRSIGERELPQKFASDEFHILIVAEKYQTGFDQPLLHTMYVDKKLEGIYAVQTLSRLNRIATGKEDSFVLDFINDEDTIREAFQDYYLETEIDNRIEHKTLYDLDQKIKSRKVYFEQEIIEFSKIFYKPRKKNLDKDQQEINRILDPAVRRFNEELSEDKQEEFRKLLTTFRKIYAFMSQIIPFRDPDLEKHYSFVRYLLAKLPRGDGGHIYNFDDEVQLEIYRLQKIKETKIPLSEDERGSVDGGIEVGAVKSEDDETHLSELIEELNRRNGTNLGEGDRLFFLAVGKEAVVNESVRKKAIANSKENFGLAFDQPLEEAFLNRMKDNKKITTDFMNNQEFREIVRDYMLSYVYGHIRGEDREAPKS